MLVVKVIIVDGIRAYRMQNAPVVTVTHDNATGLEMAPSKRVILAPSQNEPRDNNVQSAPYSIPYFDFSDDIPQPDAYRPGQAESRADRQVEPGVDGEAKGDEQGQGRGVGLSGQSGTKPEKSAKKQSNSAFGAGDYSLKNGEPPKLVVIIDDMGVARKQTQEIIDLPAPLTLAFLPYAERLDDFTMPARDKGHELIIHVPMEPMNPDLDLGPHGLRTSLERDELLSVMNEHIFNAFDGFVGINNHMGSKLTQDHDAMSWVMQELQARDLFFVDSKTIATSIGAKTAHEYNVPYAERDVFLDHVATLEAVQEALHKLEEVAIRKGVGIAIGHPKDHTIKALQNWMPQAKKRGFEFVPVSHVIYGRDADAAPDSESDRLTKEEVVKGHNAGNSPADEQVAPAGVVMDDLDVSPIAEPAPELFNPYSDY
tara:strand:+ start:1069 stop:2349 length:1281 start_codon:yes stop_codon:yes gene_type:complete